MSEWQYDSYALNTLASSNPPSNQANDTEYTFANLIQMVWEFRRQLLRGPTDRQADRQEYVNFHLQLWTAWGWEIRRWLPLDTYIRRRRGNPSTIFVYRFVHMDVGDPSPISARTDRQTGGQTERQADQDRQTDRTNRQTIQTDFRCTRIYVYTYAKWVSEKGDRV